MFNLGLFSVGCFRVGLFFRLSSGGGGGGPVITSLDYTLYNPMRGRHRLV